ncbi:O-antigen ligase family protein [Legionella spiritensis]|uniref:O-antigen biosynthesis protein n=1 Tax=Legionella spiritensis TaxID=452 RepID=A0A0W0ZBW0_LEGSP|nr:O-antigen ligase family protein [Legionella spiritensis]KTD66270.1 O-antigen biosynthesis protein [Legionella spiritensis]SNV48414.1 O-antigen biosynthesis protein [Legionella spiritensis]VEG91480.1 O-antigen biosynthesis protein [Legionella spiritensis]
MWINLAEGTWLKHRRIQNETVLALALSAFLFAIPLSNTAQSITFVVAVVLLLASKWPVDSFRYLLKQPWVMALAGFLLLVIMGCLWSPASWSGEFLVIKKYSKLLWLPVLTLGFVHPRTRHWGLHAFLGAMLLTCLVAVAKTISLGSLHNDIPGYVFRNYIMTGHMMAFASYLAGYYAITRPRWRMAYLAMFLLFSYQILFLSLGRTGYIVYFLLLFLLMVHVLNRKQLVAGLLAAGLALTLAMHYSPRMQQGLYGIVDNLQHFQQGDKSTSVGFRLQFQQFSWQLFRESPVIGHGTGSFAYYFEQRQPVPAWGKRLNEPHNQYWLIAAEYGLVGVVAYLVLLATLYLASRRLRDMKPIAVALLVPFVIGGFSDSLLFYSSSGYFFLALMALCLGEGLVLFPFSFDKLTVIPAKAGNHS